MTRTMSRATADVLFGRGPNDDLVDVRIDVDRLAALVSAALDAADPTALFEFAVRSLRTFPSVPASPVIDFTFDFPAWETA